MSRLDATDIQGFAVRGYNFPFARFLFLKILEGKKGRAWLSRLIAEITTGERWDHGKPKSTVNVAFTFKGLEALELPIASLMSFPVEFVQGMKARAPILFDEGKNAPEHWDAVWQGGVHTWLGVFAQSTAELDRKCLELLALAQESGGAESIGSQDAAALQIDGQITTKEHFGYTDGFGNPEYLGVEKDSQPGQGKLTPDGKWTPLATGELLLEYADEAGELPVAPLPHLLASNGTFMVYRKLHQNVATFRNYLKEKGKLYPGGEEKLASKFIGRWRDGTPVELSPDKADPAIVNDKNSNVNFTFGKDLEGTRCPIGAHVRRTNPRDAFGFNGQVINRRRISRRGMPYGAYIPEDQPANDDGEHGIVFMAVNASIYRQFEFVQQQWIEYGNDARQGNDKDMLIGNHGGKKSLKTHGKFMIQGTDDPKNPPFLCGGLPNFVELRGGDYFFMPSITALRLIAEHAVDPR
jgi:Dyp-type peroxidase family